MGCYYSVTHNELKHSISDLQSPLTDRILLEVPQILGARVADICDDYTVADVIGYGYYGIVRRAYSKIMPDQKFAVKSIRKKRFKTRMEMVRYEIQTLRKLNHPNIVKLYEVYEDKKYLHLVMELCDGGDLFDRLIAHGFCKESEAVHYITKILSAINFVHTHGIVHRDIKPENFIFDSEDSASEMKLIDFGL